MGTLARGEDPDEMQHKATVHQGLHCLLVLKQPLEIDYIIIYKFLPVTPLSTQWAVPYYCINIKGKIHHETKG